jgi:hypothetical protein
VAEYQDRETVPFVLRRRTHEGREAYIAEKVPLIAKRFNCTEEEARALLEGVDGAGGTLVTLPDGYEPKATPAAPSVAFILARLGEDPEIPDGMVAYVQVGDAEPVPVGEVRNRCCMYSGEMGTLAEAVKKTAEVLGAEVVQR